MFGIPLSVSPTQDFEVASHAKEVDNSIVSTRKLGNNLGGLVIDHATSSGSGADFARRLEVALEAVSGRALSGNGGKDLPVTTFATHALGDSTNLITAAGVEPTPEAALYALALSQGLDPEVVAAVLWPDFQGSDSGASPRQSTQPAVGDLIAGSPGGDSAAVHGVWDGAIPPWLAESRGGVMQPAIGYAPSSAEAERLASSSAPLDIERPPPDVAAGATDEAGRQRNELALGTNLPSTASIGPLLPAKEIPAVGFNPGRSQPGPLPSPIELMESDGPKNEPALKFSSSHSIGVSPAGSARPLLDAAALSPGHSAGSVAAVQSGLNPSAQGHEAASEEATIQTERAAALRALLSDSSARLRADLSNATGERSGGALKGLDHAVVLPAAQWMQRHARSDAVLTSNITSSGAGPGDLSVMSVEEGALEVMSAGSEFRGDPRLAPQAHNPEAIDLSKEEGGVSAASRTQADREGLQQRMSEALAQRMVAQASRGQWSLQLELKPAELGQISIEMTMNNGRLEALFDASSPAARALIAEGFDRLRQELERIGTNVAHLGMQNAFGGSPGGKPTPGRFEKRVSAGGESDSVQGDVAEGLVTQPKAHDDRRLDLMV